MSFEPLHFFEAGSVQYSLLEQSRSSFGFLFPAGFDSLTWFVVHREHFPAHLQKSFDELSVMLVPDDWASSWVVNVPFGSPDSPVEIAIAGRHDPVMLIGLVDCAYIVGAL